jgi:hypothetical protein
MITRWLSHVTATRRDKITKSRQARKTGQPRLNGKPRLGPGRHRGDDGRALCPARDLSAKNGRDRCPCQRRAQHGFQGAPPRVMHDML